jgi:hypothetical protein
MSAKMTYRLVQIGRNDVEDIPSFSFLRELSDAEVQEYDDANLALWEFKQTRRLIELVTLNESTVSGLEQHVIERSKDPSRTHEPLVTDLVHRLDASVVNYLTMTRLFLDHRQTQLKRRYGRDSPQLRAFVAQRSHECNTGPEYRFVYKLRNYVQHCGMPLQVARTAHQLFIVDDKETVRFEPLIGCSREHLLNQYNEWGPAKDFLKRQPSEFALLPLLLGFTKALQRIDRATLREEAPELWRQGKRVLSVIVDACDENHTAGIGTLDVSGDEADPDGRQYDMNVRQPEADVLERLGLITFVPGGPWLVRRDRLKMAKPPAFVD